MLHTVLFIVLQKSFNMQTIRGADHVHSKIFIWGGGACKGPVIKYLLGGVEDIFFGGGYEKKQEPLRGVRKNNRTSRGVPKS
jgi:hypothetical protein